MPKKPLLIACKLIVVGLLLYYIISSISVEALLGTLAAADLPLVVAGALCIGLALCIGPQRWRILMRAQQLDFSYLKAARWNFIGLFYNTFMPGMTGGDVIKSWYLSRESHNKTAAIMTVLVDRLAGIVGLALVGAVATSLVVSAAPEFAQARLLLYLFLTLVGAGAVAFFSQKMRAWLRVDFLITKLPFAHIFAEADRAIYIYRHHRKRVALSILFSFAIHCCVILGIYLFGLALGVATPSYSYAAMLGLIPAVFILSSFAITPAGLGVGEGLSIYLLAAVGATTEQALGIMLLFRVAQLAWGLVGGVLVVIEPPSKSLHDIEDEME